MICLCTIHGMGGWNEITDHSDRRSVNVEWVYAGGGGLNKHILWKYRHETCFHQWGVDCVCTC